MSNSKTITLRSKFAGLTIGHVQFVNHVAEVTPEGLESLKQHPKWGQLCWEDDGKAEQAVPDNAIEVENGRLRAQLTSAKTASEQAISEREQVTAELKSLQEQHQVVVAERDAAIENVKQLEAQVQQLNAAADKDSEAKPSGSNKGKPDAKS